MYDEHQQQRELITAARAANPVIQPVTIKPFPKTTLAHNAAPRLKGSKRNKKRQGG